jgi:hypothetical protein
VAAGLVAVLAMSEPAVTASGHGPLYPTKDAQVTARGRIAARNGLPVLDLLNGTTLDLTERPSGASDGVVEVTGVSRVKGRDPDKLTVTLVK